MKRFAFILFFINFFFANALLADISDFVEGMEDIPLPEKMSQLTKDDISFGNEETRLVEAYVTSKELKFSEISNFYRASLPQLGWIYQGNRGQSLLFYRDGENLEIVKEASNPLIVRLTLKTKP